MYPRKVARGDAARAWKSENPDPEQQAVMLAAVQAQAKGSEWTKEGGQYIPYPATWLRDRRWEDELPSMTERAASGAETPRHPLTFAPKTADAPAQIAGITEADRAAWCRVLQVDNAWLTPELAKIVREVEQGDGAGGPHQALLLPNLWGTFREFVEKRLHGAVESFRVAARYRRVLT